MSTGRNRDNGWISKMRTPAKGADSGMDLRDLFEDVDFMARRAASRDSNRESICLRRLAKLFTESPEIILKGLVQIAVEYCSADSAGVSLEESQDQEVPQFRWIAVAGSFEKYLNGTTPREYSPCGTCLDAHRPQHYRVNQPYYDFLGIMAEPILDGVLIPWENESMRGTIWAVSHRSQQAFDVSDYEFLKGLADFVSLAVQQQSRHHADRNRQLEAARAARANELAHAINNPLQAVANSLYLARRGGEHTAVHINQAAEDLRRVSRIVAELLRLPGS